MAQIPKGRLVKGPEKNQYVGTVPSTLQLLQIFGNLNLDIFFHTQMLLATKPR